MGPGLLLPCLSSMEYHIQMWSPQLKRDVDPLEHIQRRATEMIQGMEHLSYKNRLEELRLVILENGWL